MTASLSSLRRRYAGLALSLLCLLAGLPAQATDEHGHDHGATPDAAGTASPRFSAHSDLFELVGVVENGTMTVYLDRYATNEPVTGAKIEYESGDHKGVAQPQPDGTYAIQFDALAKAGQRPFAFTVTAGNDTDLLAGELDLHDPHDHAAEAGRPWLRWAGWAAAAAAVLALAFFLARRSGLRRGAGAFQ